jgi:hypothetical protein
MSFWRNVFQSTMDILRVPEGITFFLEIYSWESILFCVLAPFFLAIPIMLFILSIEFHFLVCIILIIVALIILYPWLVVPFWIIKESGQRREVTIWSIYNACFVIGYLFLFI